MSITHELQQAIRALRVLREQKAQELEKIDSSIRNMSTVLADLPGGDEGPQVTEVYKGLSIPQAARAYLAQRGCPAQTAEIADALLAGGITTTSRNFSTTVYSILREAKGFTRLENGAGWWLEDEEVPHG